jgi:cyclopropane-fatty-acyl-phospholipid synthase
MVVRAGYFMTVSKISYIVNNKCVINGKRDLVTIIKLPNYPLTEQFGKYNKKFPNFDQELMISKSSGHVQLKYILDQKYLYSPINYKYKTKVSHSTNHALEVFISFFNKNFHGKINSILDVGGNDNYIVNKIAKKKTKKYVIDPVAKKGKDGVIVINKFLENVDLSRDIVQPNVVICRHTLEHIPDPKKFIRKLLNECRDDCRFIFEVPSLERMIETQRFDTIMHQHMSYFSARSLRLLIESCGGKIISHKIFDKGSCGGSILFCFKKIKNNNENKKIKNLTKKQFQRDFKTIKHKITIFKDNMKILNELINACDNQVIGYGAGLMLATYMYFLNIRDKKIKYILDDDKTKHNSQYKNLNVKIKFPKKIEFKKNENYIVTSLENKKTLVSKILRLNPNNVYFPSPA